MVRMIQKFKYRWPSTDSGAKGRPSTGNRQESKAKLGENQRYLRIGEMLRGKNASVQLEGLA